MTHVAGAGPVFTSADQLGSPLRYASAMCQQLGHNPARCVHTGVCQDDRIALRRAFCHGARHQLTVALGKIGVARLPRRKLGGVTSYLGGPGNNLFCQVLGRHCLNRANILNGPIVMASAFDAQMGMTVVQVQENPTTEAPARAVTPLVSYQINRQHSGWNSSSTDNSRLRGALPTTDIRAAIKKSLNMPSTTSAPNGCGKASCYCFCRIHGVDDSRNVIPTSDGRGTVISGSIGIPPNL